MLFSGQTYYWRRRITPHFCLLINNMKGKPHIIYWMTRNRELTVGFLVCINRANDNDSPTLISGAYSVPSLETLEVSIKLFLKIPLQSSQEIPTRHLSFRWPFHLILCKPIILHGFRMPGKSSIITWWGSQRSSLGFLLG